jgi:predicted TIM-barrel fold metal-dependent hydrolase
MIDVNAYLGHFAFRRLRYNTAGELLRLMDRAKIERALVSSAASITYRNAHSGNEELASEVKLYRDRLLPLAVLNPAYAGWQADLRHCHEEMGMKGLRLYPRWHNYRLTDASCLEMVEAATARGMVISIPVRVEDRRQQSWLVDVPDVDLEEIASLVEKAPKSTFILVNGAGFLGSRLGRAASGLPSNFVIDISRLGVELGNEAGKLLAALGEDRLVFGTGIPFHYPDPALIKLALLEAGDEVKEKIRRRTAARLLGLAPDRT